MIPPCGIEIHLAKPSLPAGSILPEFRIPLRLADIPELSPGRSTLANCFTLSLLFFSHRSRSPSNASSASRLASSSDCRLDSEDCPAFHRYHRCPECRLFRSSLSQAGGSRDRCLRRCCIRKRRNELHEHLSRIVRDAG
jgi:hypothetical protein